jgi:Late embryogenesis abundant protein
LSYRARFAVFALGFSLLLLGSVGCATLDALRVFIQPPRFEQDDQQRSQIRLVGNGASVRLWTRVTNPNDFGLTLGTLNGTLYLEGSRAANVNFPFGLPLQPRAEEVVPIDITVNFADIPALSQTIARAISRQPIDYELEGTIGVSAGRFGEPVFGPMTLLRGEVR